MSNRLNLDKTQKKNTFSSTLKLHFGSEREIRTLDLPGMNHTEVKNLTFNKPFR